MYPPVGRIGIVYIDIFHRQRSVIDDSAIKYISAKDAYVFQRDILSCWYVQDSGIQGLNVDDLTGRLHYMSISVERQCC